MATGTNIIDAALRFARSNAELVDSAREGALISGRTVDDLLTEAIARMRRDGERQPYVSRSRPWCGPQPLEVSSPRPSKPGVNRPPFRVR